MLTAEAISPLSVWVRFGTMISYKAYYATPQPICLATELLLSLGKIFQADPVPRRKIMNILAAVHGLSHIRKFLYKIIPIN